MNHVRGQRRRDFRRDEDGDTSLTTFRTYDSRTVEIISQFDGETDFLYVSDLGGGLWTIYRMAGDGRGTVTTTAAPDGPDALACTDPRLLWADGRLTAASGIDVRFVDAQGRAVETHEMVRLSDGAVVHRIDHHPPSLGGVDRTIEYDASGAVVLETVFREDGTKVTRTYQPYTAVSGDTLSEIAQRYGLSLAELLAIPDNLPFRADPNRLRAGADVVSVPAEVREYDARGALLLLEVFAHAAPEEFFDSWSDDFAHDTAIRFYDRGLPGHAYEIATAVNGEQIVTYVGASAALGKFGKELTNTAKASGVLKAAIFGLAGTIGKTLQSAFAWIKGNWVLLAFIGISDMLMQIVDSSNQAAKAIDLVKVALSNLSLEQLKLKKQKAEEVLKGLGFQPKVEGEMPELVDRKEYARQRNDLVKLWEKEKSESEKGTNLCRYRKIR